MPKQCVIASEGRGWTLETESRDLEGMGGRCGGESEVSARSHTVVVVALLQSLAEANKTSFCPHFRSHERNSNKLVWNTL